MILDTETFLSYFTHTCFLNTSLSDSFSLTCPISSLTPKTLYLYLSLHSQACKQNTCTLSFTPFSTHSIDCINKRKKSVRLSLPLSLSVQLSLFFSLCLVDVNGFIHTHTQICVLCFLFLISSYKLSI